MAVINGTLENDNWDNALYGTEFADLINMKAGDDWLVQSYGSDGIFGGDGFDVVMYGDLSGGVIINQTNVERLGVAAFSTLKDNGDIDSFDSVEAFHGTNFDDSIFMSIDGYAFGEGGNDFLTCVAPSGTNGFFIPGLGADTVVGNGSTGIAYNEELWDDPEIEALHRGITVVVTDVNEGFVIDRGGFEDVFSGVAYVYGSLYNDVMIAGTGDAHFEGLDGNDYLYGGSGNDLLTGGAGKNLLDGKSGSDYYVYEYDGNTTIRDESGTDTIALIRPDDTYFEKMYYVGTTLKIESTDGDTLTIQKFSNIEFIHWTGPTFDYSISTADIFAGTLSNDSITTSTVGYVEVYAADGNDTITVRAGGSWVSCDAGNDTAFGGSGGDAIYGDFRADAFGNDSIKGLAGADSLNGDGGKDTLDGGSENDLLEGGAGNDFLYGGTGMDILTGGDGSDRFVFTLVTETTTGATTCDQITDFVRGQDKIDLGAIDASTITTGNNSFVFKGTSAIGTSNDGEIYYRQFNNEGTDQDYTLVYIDNDKDVTAEAVIKLTGLVALSSADFVL